MDSTDNPTSLQEASAEINATDQGDLDKERPPKRQRVAAACDECRSRKVKCDGTWPVCGPCSRKHGPSTICTWGVRKGRSVAKSKEELLQLRRRIRELETGPRQAPSAENSTREATASSLPSGERITTTDSNESNAMMGLIEDDPRSSSRNYGDSSAMGFMNQIKSAIHRQIAAPRDSQVTSLLKRTQFHSSSGGGSRSKEKRSALDYILPPRHRADHLLSVYWRLVDPLYSFLDTDEIETLYRRVWTGEDLGEDGPVFLCLLNATFSISCILDPSATASSRVKSADVFYQRCCDLLDFEQTRHRSILTVQCFLLLGQYLQSTNDPQQCWIFVGLAIRIAQSLSLDLPSTSLAAPTIHKRNFLRKIWHGCILMDRTLSMTFGRPAMIASQAANAVPHPMTHPEGAICNCHREACPVDSAETASHFFIEALKLYDLMSETLVALYHPESPDEIDDDAYSVYFGSLGARAVGNMLEIDKALRAWYHGLPIHLRHESDAITVDTHRRQANVLWFRYLHIRILLFRPVLSRFCSRHETGQIPIEDCFSWKIAFQCSLSCVKSALETINYLKVTMADRRLEDLDDLLPAWWYTIFYTYTAATVLVAARLQESIMADVTEKAINDAWWAVRKILKRLQNFSKHATRCAAALSILFEQVPQRRLGQQQLLSQHQRSLGPGSNTKQSQASSRSGVRQQQPLLVQMPGSVEMEPEERAGPIHTSMADTNPMEFSQATLTESREGRQGTPLESGNHFTWSFDDPFTETVDFDDSAPDFASAPEFFNVSEIQIGLGDMSWLTSLPTQLYDN